MILSGQNIERRGILWPCWSRQKHFVSGTTYGVGPASYDVTLDLGYNRRGVQRRWLFMWPGITRLAAAVEKFTMPNDVAAVVHDKSTWIRRGLSVHNTFIDPGWCGFLTLELTLHRFWPMILRRGVPIAQIVFHHLDEPAAHPYDGKYQNQAEGPQAAR